MLLTHILKRNAKFVENDTDGSLRLSIAHARQCFDGRGGKIGRNVRGAGQFDRVLRSGMTPLRGLYHPTSHGHNDLRIESAVSAEWFTR